MIVRRSGRVSGAATIGDMPSTASKTKRRASPKAARVKSVLRLPASSDAPMYEQIRELIRQKIHSGKWAPGYRLPTLGELSIQLGVAYATVERAVRELTQEGLLEGRKRGGTRVIQPRRKTVDAIGILGFTEFGRLHTHSRYFSTVLMLLQEKIIDHGRMVVYDYAPHDKPFSAAFNGLTHVDGMIVFDPDGLRTDDIRACLRVGVPSLCVGERSEPDVPAVATASLASTQRAIEHMISLGHEHLACVAHSFRINGPAVQCRIEGFRRAMAGTVSGFRTSQLLIGDPSAQAQALLKLRPAPTALFAPQSNHFPELFGLLKGTHLEPGRHTSICTFDDNLTGGLSSLGIEFFSVEQRMDRITSETVDTLIKMIQDPTFAPGHVEVPASLFHVDQHGHRAKI
jgi:DNA-binding LacI/PurR family transcriptional regulator